MDPAGSILNLIKKGTAHDIIAYYTQCAGNSPFDKTFTQAQNGLNNLNYNFTSYYSTADSYLKYYNKSTECLSNSQNGVSII
jgi:hypothetical protein